MTYTVNASNAAAIYVNGVEQAASTFGTSPTDHDRTLMLGKSINSQHQAFDGKIDEVGVWYRVLNATEINMLYNRGDGWTY